MSSTIENIDAADSLLSDLTEPQLQAVTHVDGPLLVVAAAGSGKTRVITRRVANLILRVGIPPWNVVAITFTNKAASEMQQRVASMMAPAQARAVTLSTFHSLCARILRHHAGRLGLKPSFSIYDTADQKRAVKQVMADLQISTTNFQPATVLAAISNAKNELHDAEAFAGRADDYFASQVARVYRAYEALLHKNHALDFDDLLLRTVGLMRGHEDVLTELRQRFQYILIDEYQDTNHAQFILAHALAAEHRNLCATGDPDQSIYSWRGADIRNILEFEEHYPDAKVVNLEQNYRSTKHILAAADTMIRNNRRRKHKSLWTENETGDPVRIVTCLDETREAESVVAWFRQLREQHDLPWSSFAVFYRTNALSRILEEQLLHDGIPYQIARGTAFYDRKEIKNAVAYLRAVANPDDEVNLLRIINTPARGISSATVKAAQARAAADGISLADLCDDPTPLTTLNVRAVRSVAVFGESLRNWRAHRDGRAPEASGDAPRSLRTLVECICRESGLEDLHRSDKNDPEQQRLANLGELISAAHQFELQFEEQLEEGAAPDGFASAAPAERGSLAEKLNGFLERISLVSDVDAVDAEQGSLTLMTLHAAKGLEFPAVAIIGVEEGLLPHAQSQDDETKLEEERRLCFVGITRARRFLAVSRARSRTIFGRTQPTIPSRFLNELPNDDVQAVNDAAPPDGFDTFTDETASAQGASQRRAAAAFSGHMPPGTMVNHPQFGRGRVLKITPAGAHTRARIDFEYTGIKTLVLQYARLEILE
jgi:DNA helicase-2/ATP-dependent DNA helicase PcrA